MSYEDEIEDPEYGTEVADYSDSNVPKLKGCKLFKRGNMYFLLRNGLLIDKSHVEDLEFLLGFAMRGKKKR